MSKDRREHKRYNIGVLLKGQILRKDKKVKLTEDIPVLSKDVSLGGIRLNWPKKWECKRCNRCLGWVFNFGCRYKKELARKINRELDQEIILKIKIDVEKGGVQEVLAKVVWTQIKEKEDNYDVGLNFIDTDKKSIEGVKSLIKRGGGSGKQ